MTQKKIFKVKCQLTLSHNHSAWSQCQARRAEAIIQLRLNIKQSKSRFRLSEVASCTPDAALDWFGCILIWSRYWYDVISGFFVGLHKLSADNQDYKSIWGYLELWSLHWLSELSDDLFFKLLILIQNLNQIHHYLSSISEIVFNSLLDWSIFCVCGLVAQNEVINEQWMMPRPKMSGSSSDNSSQKRILPISVGEPKVQSLLMRRVK